MDIKQKRVRVNLEEAIAAIHAVDVLNGLEIDDIDWYSDGEAVELMDLHYPDQESPLSRISLPIYIKCGNFVIVEKPNE